MIRKIAVIAAAALLSIIAGSALAKDDPELRAAARNYVEHPVTQGALDTIWSMETMRSLVITEMRAQGTTLSSDDIEVLSRILQEEFDRLRPQFETVMVNVVIEVYSLEEIQALNEFYSSDVGASAIMKTGMMMRTFNSSAAPLLQKFYERLGVRIDEVFPE